MGTSKGISTPSGGGWTSVKGQITDMLGGTVPLNTNSLISGVVAAAGGLGSMTGTGTGGGGVGAAGGSGGGHSRGSSGKVSVGGAVSGLAGFANAVQTGGLDAGVDALGLADLRGRAAVEVVARIADRLAAQADGPQADLIAIALKDAILDCAALESGGTYDDLDNAIQGFLSRDGIEGLVEAFLGRFVFDRVWAWIETHTDERSQAVPDTQALASAIEGSCREHVRQLMDDLRSEGKFDRTDWFGREGVQLGQGIVSTLEYRLQSLQSEQA